MRFLKWIGQAVIGTVLITSITMFMTWYVVNMYIEDIFRQYHIPALGKKAQFSEFATRMAEELNILKPKESRNQAVEAPAPATDKAPQPTPTAGPSPSGSLSLRDSSANDGSRDGKGTESAQEDAVAVMGRAGSDEDMQKKDLVVSTEELAKKKEAISSEDKMEIFSLVVAKLPQNEVQRLSALMENGITTEELQEVDQILKKYLNEQEYSQLIAIIKKY